MRLWFVFILLGVATPKNVFSVVAMSGSEGTEIDVTFFPGLTDQYEDAASLGEWHRFLEEEKDEVEREEEVIVRLLQEEHKLQLDEPIEFTTQKRVMKQFNDLKKKRPSPDYLSSVQLKGPTYVSASGLSDFLRPTVEEVSLETLHEIKPSDIMLLEPENPKYVAYDVGSNVPSTTARPNRHELEREQQERIKDLEYAFEHPKIDAIPDATISRLLSLTPSNGREAARNTFRHGHHAIRHGPLGVQHNKQKKDSTKDHKERQQFLFHRLLEKQRLIAPEDLSFLLGSDEEKRRENDHVIRDSEPRKKESLEDWEEDYEYDA